ncbi:MAG: DNA methyltransferase [Candidatus Nitrosocaldus sp.]
MPKPSNDDLEEHTLPRELLDRILLGNARIILRDIPSNSIHFMVTSPPYNVGKEYDDDISVEEYLELIHDVMLEVYRL